MIFVMLGTQNNSFERLIKQIDCIVTNKGITEEIVVQSGYTKYVPQNSNISMMDFMEKDKILENIHKASYVITHGGVGSIIDCLKQNKKVIAVARDSKFNEHVNDHQKQIVKMFNDKKYLLGICDVSQLENAIEQVDEFVPQKYVSDNSKLLGIVDEFVGKVVDGI